MRIHIEVELSAEEIPAATELFKVLQHITANVRPRDTKKLMIQLFQQLIDNEGNNVDNISQSVNSLLNVGGEEFQEDLFNDLFNSFSEVAFSPVLIKRSISISSFIQVILRLPEAYKARFRESLVSLVMKVLNQKRGSDADRVEFYLHAEVFAVLVTVDFVSIPGAIQTITSLLKKPATRCAALTMLGKTLELCLENLCEKCEPQLLVELYKQVISITDDYLQYDVNYARDALKMLRLPDGTKLSDISLDGKPSFSLPSSSATTPLPTTPSIPVIPTATAPLHVNTTMKNVALSPTNSFTGGHTAPVFALCYDNIRDNIITASKDGTVVTWAPDGKVLSQHYVSNGGGGFGCSMDMNGNGTMLYVAVKDYVLENSRIPVLIGYEVGGLPGATKLSQRGVLRRKDDKLMTCVKSVNDGVGNQFVLSESNKLKQHLLCWYDINSGNFDELYPIRTYADHEDIITSIVQVPSNPNLFFSSSRDYTIRLWDTRQAVCASTIGYPARDLQINPDRLNIGHGETVASLDIMDNVLVSVDIQEKVMVWDVRQLISGTRGSYQSIKLPSTPFKVTLGPNTANALISTVKGLRLYNLPSNTITEVPPLLGKEDNVYNDMKWNILRDHLYAANNNGSIDVYSANYI